MSIYTRTGDRGTTALFGGKRVQKNHPLIECIGVLDELNSGIGIVSTSCKTSKVKDNLENIQSDIFTISSVLSGATLSLKYLKNRVHDIEQDIDTMDSALPTLTSFILPGGSERGAYIFYLRSLCRKCERTVVHLLHIKNNDVRLTHEMSSNIVVYINRLSDYFFVLARFTNSEDKMKELTWKGLQRKT